MQITDLRLGSRDHLSQTAHLLFDSFKTNWPNGWPTLESAYEEVLESLGDDRISRIAVQDSQLIGWVGAIRQYDGHVWELHPLVVRADRRLEGIGRLLVEDLQRLIAAKGGLTLWLGSDDENNMTSLSTVDLYTNPWDQIRNIRNYKNHPYEFYQKLGFSIVGVMPDANGLGKPDIYLAKRVRG